MNVSVYIAAPYTMRSTAQTIRANLLVEGIDCTARWIVDDSADALSDEWARNDLADVTRCDVLVAINPIGFAEKGTGGRHVELGYALALHKPIVLVGVRSNIFHYLTDVTVVDFGRNGLEFLALNIREAARRAGVAA